MSLYFDLGMCGRCLCTLTSRSTPPLYLLYLVHLTHLMGVGGGEIGVKLVHWNPDGFKIGLCDVAPAAQTKALLCLANKYACVCVCECGCVGV